MGESVVKTEPVVDPETTSKWKIPPTRVASDDCVVYVGRVIEDGEIKDAGTAYHVHEGEWVELLPCRSLAEIMALSDIAMSALNGTESLRTLCQTLSQRIVSWNWTGMEKGVALPQPHDDAGVLEQLTDDELMWLMAAAQGKETEAVRKNA